VVSLGGWQHVSDRLSMDCARVCELRRFSGAFFRSSGAASPCRRQCHATQLADAGRGRLFENRAAGPWPGPECHVPADAQYCGKTGWRLLHRCPGPAAGVTISKRQAAPQGPCSVREEQGRFRGVSSNFRQSPVVALSRRLGGLGTAGSSVHDRPRPAAAPGRRGPTIVPMPASV